MNRLFLLLFGMVTFVAHAQVPDYVPTEGLVAWYPLDGDGQDMGPLELHGTTIGTECGANRFNQSCGAVTFTNGDRIVIETDSSHSSSELTVCFWAKLDDVQSYNHFLNRWEGSDYEFVLSSNNTGLYLYVGNTLFLSDHLPTLHEWHHLTFWYSSTTGSAGILEDGVSVAEFSGIPETPPTNFPMHIGGIPVGASYNSVNGEMDDLAIWNRALTEEEITALYTAELPVSGCTDPTACNFDAEATSDDGSCIPSGCMEPLACNYNALAECEGEACDYTCCPGPGCCSTGTIWDYELEQCVPTESTCPEDLDFDGVVGVNDLMELLSAFGTDCAPAEEPETAEWACGDPVSYHGYDYSTVEIGEQCWFAENLRTEHYNNGDTIPGELSNNAWEYANSGAQSIYNNDASNLADYGRLYNWHAVDDARGLCPSGWHVPTDGEFMALEVELGMSESDANDTGWRGTNEGAQMKSSATDSPAWDGTNTSGFSGLASGLRNPNGQYGFINISGLFWTQSLSSLSVAISRALDTGNSAVNTDADEKNRGFSIRCLKD